MKFLVIVCETQFVPINFEFVDLAFKSDFV
jgi:hypothetical protein